jgi:hypothetical protein
LSDHEFIVKAAQQAIEDSRRHQDAIPYASVDDFFGGNPNCCLLFRDGHPVLTEGNWVRALGWYVAVVEVWHKVRELGPDNYYRSYVSLNSCGKVLQRDVFTEPSPRR